MKETPLPYKIKLELETEEERTFLRIALQKAHACAFGAIMDSRNDSELDEKTKQFNIERFSREMRLYARLLARLADATDEAEPWRAAGAGGGEEEGRVKDVRVIIEGTVKEIAELLPNLTQAEVRLETENINSNNQEMQMLQNLVKAMAEYAASHSEEQQAAEK